MMTVSISSAKVSGRRGWYRHPIDIDVAIEQYGSHGAMGFVASPLGRITTCQHLNSCLNS
jgi:hypothetical protein